MNERVMISPNYYFTLANPRLIVLRANKDADLICKTANRRKRKGHPNGRRTSGSHPWILP